MQTTCYEAAKFQRYSWISRPTAAALNVLIRANALPLSITIIVAVKPQVNETNISSANINDDFALEIY